MNVDMVFEGGGAKIPGLVGVLSSLEPFGYTPYRFAGASSGAIVSALGAAGYSPKEMAEILLKLKFTDLLAGGTFGTKLFNLWKHHGIYSGAKLERFIGGLLDAKGVKTFEDLALPGGGYKLKVVVSDITNHRLTVFPDDASYYGLDPDKVSVAWAVHCSLAIPGFFRPVTLETVNGPIVFVDGGMLSNFPVWIYDSPIEPQWPTFGVLLEESESKLRIVKTSEYVYALYKTLLTAHDKMSMERAAHQGFRTIRTPVGRVKTTDFNVSLEEKLNLFSAGVKAGTDFLSKFSWDDYLERRRIVIENKEVD